MSNREIKFRAWDTERNCYQDQDYCVRIKTQKVQGYYGQLFPEMELEQYTGLKDKNGVEIYEGDIISGSSSNMFTNNLCKNYKVIWGVDRWHIEGTTFENLQEFLNYCDLKCEVIGNIHENKDLLD